MEISLLKKGGEANPERDLEVVEDSTGKGSGHGRRKKETSGDAGSGGDSGHQKDGATKYSYPQNGDIIGEMSVGPAVRKRERGLVRRTTK